MHIGVSQETESTIVSLDSIVSNAVVRDDSGVWLLRGHGPSSHSEESTDEQYLRRALTSVRNLGVNSPELARWIRDRSSEHHLSPRRSQLLSGFHFDRNQKVLEIGCGCGAITRFLGETFAAVVSLERSLSRARLSRLRTRDLDTVSIVCAPFPEIQFAEKFDIIFVGDGSEVSSWFADGVDRNDRAFERLASFLAPGGVLIIAIDNQAGVKYRGSSADARIARSIRAPEDQKRAHARTAAKLGLEDGLRRHFSEVRLFYPFPDHELPDCVLSSELVSSRRAAELVSQMQIALRDQAGTTKPAWTEVPTWLELARNGMMELFSNSFLVVAGATTNPKVAFDQLGILFSSGRREVFTTLTRVVRNPSGDWIVSKNACADAEPAGEELLKHVNTNAKWVDGLSLRTVVLLRAMSNDMDIQSIFSPCRIWADYLTGTATVRNGTAMLGGEHVDSIWQNVYVSDADEERLEIIDREWVWREEIPLAVIVIRAIFQFLALPSGVRAFGPPLQQRSARRLIRQIAETLGVALQPKDFAAFIDLEAQIHNAVFGTSEVRTRIYLELFLADRRLLEAALWHRAMMASLAARIADRIFSTVTGVRRKIGIGRAAPETPSSDMIDRAAGFREAAVQPLPGQARPGRRMPRQLPPRGSGHASDSERPASIASKR